MPTTTSAGPPGAATGGAPPPGSSPRNSAPASPAEPAHTAPAGPRGGDAREVVVVLRVAHEHPGAVQHAVAHVDHLARGLPAQHLEQVPDHLAVDQLAPADGRPPLGREGRRHHRGLGSRSVERPVERGADMPAQQRVELHVEQRRASARGVARGRVGGPRSTLPRVEVEREHVGLHARVRAQRHGRTEAVAQRLRGAVRRARQVVSEDQCPSGRHRSRAYPRGSRFTPSGHGARSGLAG